MSSMKYSALVSIHEKPQNGQQNISLVDLSKIPVRSFSVVGGTSRSIDLDSTDEFSMGNEFEQARRYNNITLFVPPTKDFTAVKLFTLRSSGLKFFTLFFQVSIHSGGQLTQSLILETSHAWLLKNPTPVGNKEALLMLEVRFNNVQLLHGKLNQKSHEFVHEEI